MDLSLRSFLDVFLGGGEFLLDGSNLVSCVVAGQWLLNKRHEDASNLLKPSKEVSLLIFELLNLFFYLLLQDYELLILLLHPPRDLLLQLFVLVLPESQHGLRVLDSTLQLADVLLYLLQLLFFGHEFLSDEV